MPYISADGRIGSPSGRSLIPSYFWGILDFIFQFFRTLINPGKSNQEGSYTGSYGSSGRGPPPPGPPPRRMGRIRHGGGGPSPPPMMGGG